MLVTWLKRIDIFQKLQHIWVASQRATSLGFSFICYNLLSFLFDLKWSIFPIIDLIESWEKFVVKNMVIESNRSHSRNWYLVYTAFQTEAEVNSGNIWISKYVVHIGRDLQWVRARNISSTTSRIRIHGRGKHIDRAIYYTAAPAGSQNWEKGFQDYVNYVKSQQNFLKINKNSIVFSVIK